MSDSNERRFIDLQNRFRGLVANLRIRRFVEDRNFDPIQRFRSGLNELFLDMRAALSVEQYPLILDWVAEQLAGQLNDVVQAPLHYDELSGVHARAPTVSLDRELLWTSYRIRMEAEKLTALSNTVDYLSKATLHGAYEDALAALTLLQERLGVSLWSVQLRLALEQQAGGLERQKRYSAEVRKVYKRGLLGFTTYHTSVRNEDRTTLVKFLDDVEHRIENHTHYDDAIKTYARYRLKGEFPVTDAGMADILKVEQNHTIVDVYQTFIAVIQEIIARGPTAERRQVLLTAVANLPTGDFRVAKIAHYLDPVAAMPAESMRSTASFDALLEQQFKRAALLASRRCRTSIDPWDFVYAGVAHASLRNGPGKRTPLRPSNIVPTLAAILARVPDAADVASQLSKLALNFRGLPFAAGLAQFEILIRRARPDAEWAPFRLGLHSPSFGIEDLRPGQRLPSEIETQRSKANRFWWTALGHDPASSAENDVSKLALALRGVLSGDLESTVDFTRDADEWRSPLREFGIQARLHGLFARGDRTGVVALLAREGARGTAFSQFLPISASLEGLGWADYKEVENPIAAPIALHLLWSEGEDSKIASLLRFAASHSLRVPHKRKPSTFAEQPILYSRDELVYFLRYVCVPNILDQARIVSGTRGIMEERQAICSLLIELDEANTAAYNEEITTIAEQMAIDEGQWIVDSTRIYVDTEALSRWAQRELKEDFGRYRDLAGVEVGHVQSFEDVLRELLETNPASRSTYTPENEAEVVLVSMLRRLGQEFLSNPVFGLDFNLSKRVRHQSFTGLIRGPIESSQIITTRESEAGDYHRNDYWLDRFTKGKDVIDLALRNFASNFDDTLAVAKDTALHLRSPERPDGLIVLNLSAGLIAIARGIIGLDVSFNEFISSAIIILWRALDSSLQAARELISVELKAKLTHAFDELRAAVRKVAEGDPAFFEFDAAVGNGSAEVQNRLDEAANWFQHANRIRQETTFTLEQVVKIAVDTALKSQRNYSPVLNYQVDGELLMYAGNLIFVHDVLFVALGNAQKHSGLNTPTIDVHVSHDADASTLEIEAICDSRAANRPASEERVKAIRALIDSGSIAPRTRKEGGSGFVKLAAVVGQSRKGGVDFGYTNDGRFRLSVTYGIANLPEGAAHGF